MDKIVEKNEINKLLINLNLYDLTIRYEYHTI